MRTSIRSLLILSLLALSGCGMGLPGAKTAGSGGMSAQGWDLNSSVMGDCPNFAQASNGDMMTVVARDHGRGAKPGAMIELYYPSYAHDNLWDSYVGVEVRGKVRWAHDLKLERQAMVPDTGRIESDFGAADVGLSLRDVVDPAHNVHLRKVTVTNRGQAPLSGASVDAYAFFTINELPGGDRLHYDAGAHAMVQSEGKIAVALASDVTPSGWHCGLANIPVGGSRDARVAAEGGQWDNTASAGPATTGVNGALRLPLPTLAPGASATLTLAYAAAANEPTAVLTARNGLAAGFEAIANADQQRWGAWLASTVAPARMSDAALAVYRRAMVTLGQMTAANGAIMAAATNLSPLYRFVWPRDGSLTAITEMRAGHPEAAKAFFAFAERLQRADGGFAVNYLPDASHALWEFGATGDEHDQIGLFAWGVGKVIDQTHDAGFAAARWPAVKRACGFLMSVQTPDGLLGPCRDLWELDTGGSWTFSNGAAWAGLTAGAKQAAAQGDMASASRFQAAANKLKAQIASRLIVNGRYVRGLRGSTPDTAIEVANLALGSSEFGMVDDNDPAMLATGEAIEARLSTADGGVRRHEGDHYYGGQPWPVTTAWLAKHEAATGHQQQAAQRLNTLTAYAQNTDSLQLGEQFDVGAKQWVSAFPLTWSEAGYVSAALEMGGF